MGVTGNNHSAKARRPQETVIISFSFEFACASLSKRFLVQKLSHENKFYLHENEPVGKRQLRNYNPFKFYYYKNKIWDIVEVKLWYLTVLGLFQYSFLP